MMSAIPSIIQDAHPSVGEDYKRQKDRALAMMVLGIILVVGSIIGLYFTVQSHIAFPISFTVTLLLGVMITLWPLTYHWTAYHSCEFKEQLKGDFRAYDQTEGESFKKFLSRYRIAKLHDFGMIDNQVQDAYAEAKIQLLQEGVGVQGSIVNWNQFINGRKAQI